jgi:hypothetical protein
MNDPTQNQKLLKQLTRVSSRTYEPVGIIPRSILRTLERFMIQLVTTSTEGSVMAEHRVSTYQAIISVQALMALIFLPLIVHFLSMKFVLTPATDYLWNSQQADIFLNTSLEQRALQDLQHFEDELYFDHFSCSTDSSPTWALYQMDNPMEFSLIRSSRLQERVVDLARDYNQKSITYLTAFFGDLVTLTTIIFVMLGFKAQMIIFKSFVLEFLYSLSDTIKSVLLIFSTNLLVGFHSPRGWELLLEVALNRFGFPPSEHFVLLFVATFPVFLDTIFKYWIFRYLNKISPSTVATYHSMLE